MLTDDGHLHVALAVGFAIGGVLAFLAEVTVTNNLLTLIVAVIPVLGAIWLSRKGTKKEIASVELKVDGRLEAALERIDKLEAQKAAASGEPAPPPVSGLNQPTPPLDPT